MHSIEDIIAGRTGHEQLTDPHIAALREMMTSTGWKIYLRALQWSIDQYMETLISAQTGVNVEHLRGQIAGMRSAALLPAAQIEATEYARAAEQRARDRSKPRSINPVLRALATYGTPSWGNRNTPASSDPTP